LNYAKQKKDSLFPEDRILFCPLSTACPTGIVQAGNCDCSPLTACALQAVLLYPTFKHGKWVASS